ncbi:hypothetical protein RHMOL_Rhmol09G0177600 [Rhododendron molle]|uniref:Uncharacterized protein n=1 Tax=Rhododendron molle TaxID=49168 RepID=A0ACC0MET1_RHOML|nr:hypothetical protein RHMOL_Rhmol09G0177600 [Rhododendron molle]
MGSCEVTQYSYSKYGTGSGDNQDCAQTIEKERDDHEAVETLNVFCAEAAGVALVGWGFPKLGGASGEKIVKKLMKAPGKDFLIFREKFELNPAAYFRSLRN